MDIVEMRLAAKLLRLAADEFGHHCSNDMSLDFFDGLSDEQKIELASGFYAYNRDTDMIRDFATADTEGKLRQFERIGDYAWMSYFASRLEEGAIYLSFPVQILPHFVPGGLSLEATDPDSLAYQIKVGIMQSPVGDVSLKFDD